MDEDADEVEEEDDVAEADDESVAMASRLLLEA
jgi:hypothetical protein